MATAKSQPAVADRKAKGSTTWKEPKVTKRIITDEKLAKQPEFEKLISGEKVKRFREPQNLGEYAGFPYVVCSFKTERAESGHYSMREATEVAREKWGPDYHRHGLVMKVKSRSKAEQPGEGNSR